MADDTNTITDEILKDWDNRPEPGDDLFKYFAEAGLRYWLNISDEGLRLHNLMFDDNAECFSAPDNMCSAMALAGARGAFKAVADAIGNISAEDLEMAVDDWYDVDARNVAVPPGVGWEKLRIKIADARQFHADLKDRPSKP